MDEVARTINPMANDAPPSSCKLTPRTVKWLPIAPPGAGRGYHGGRGARWCGGPLGWRQPVDSREGKWSLHGGGARWTRRVAERDVARRLVHGDVAVTHRRRFGPVHAD